MVIGIPRCAAVLSLLVLLSPHSSAQQAAGASRADDLMKRGLYQDAVRVLLEETKGQPEEQCGQKFLMLAESYYMLKQYAEARPYFAKALRDLKEDGPRLIAEYRLACVAYRLGDAAGALEKIDAFVARFPTNERSGVLLVFKMKLLAARGKKAQAEVEAVHRQIQSGTKAYGHAAGYAADKILTDFYVETGQEERARERYASTVHGFKNVIAEYAKDKRPVPAALEQAHDHAAMQLGAISLKARKLDEAVKWLENVKYDAELKREARLLLAQVAYQKRDFDRAVWLLTQEGFVETVPAGNLRSDMYLLLGLCEKSKQNPNLDKVVDCLGKVGQGSDGYFQAQVGLGDLYRERGLADRAIQAYENAAPSPKYEPQVLYWLGRLCLEKAEQATDRAKADPLYRKAAEKLSQLTTKYPGSQLAKQASESVDALLRKGFDVSVAMSDEEMARRWEQAVREKPGSAEAARSLINLARLHQKSLMDQRGEKFLKAPNYAACASACDRLLDAKAYTGKDFAADQWRDLRVEALYYRALCHLASATATGKDAAGPIAPTYLKPASLDKAVEDFAQAKQLVDPKRLDLVKSIELGLLEAMLKSDKQDLRERARARFAELVNEYGTDVRFQKLAMDLAEWYRAQGQFAEAAREYKGVADRGANLSQEDRLKALFMAGKLYSKAAYEARHTPGETKHGIYIGPKEVLKVADLLKTHKPFQKKITVKWPEKARELNGEEALRIVSEASGIPFVWSPEGGQASVADALRRKRVRFQSLSGTVEEFLRQVLDMENHRLTLDIGLTGGKPTIEPKPADQEDPEMTETAKAIEIYDQRRWAKRYRPLGRDYGTWRDVHRKPAMLYNVVQRIEEISGTRVLWSEGVEKDAVLATEYRAIPGAEPGMNLSCAETLRALLSPLELRYQVLPRDRSAELYEEAKGCFNQIRQIDPRSKYGENALFLVALNYCHQEDYGRMKVVLREYLKLFDTPSHEHYHQACFWVGWAFEHDKQYRDACRYYSRAAEEGLVVFKPAADEKRPSREELKARLSYDTRLALDEPVNGAFKNYTLAKEFVDFVRMNANVSVRLDASAVNVETAIHREPFRQVPAFDILCETLEKLGLCFRVENVNREEAERACYRMASAYKKDEQMERALDSCSVLLSRFPTTNRRKDALKLKLEIYKGLKRYRDVLATLEQLKAALGDEIEAYKIDFEMAWIYFDLCRYPEAVDYFKKSLGAAKDPRERINIRDGYARALFRKGDLQETLLQYQALAKEEPEPLRAFIDRQMVWYLEQATANDFSKPRPPDVSKLMRDYEALRDEQRSRLPAATLAKATWVYYVAALADLHQGHTEKALPKLEAAGNSPDDWLAADALFRAGELYRTNPRSVKDAKEPRDHLKKAKETFEYLLFATKSAETEVRATYSLGLCLEELGDAAGAKARFAQVLDRFPDSSYADKVRAKLGTEPKKAAK